MRARTPRVPRPGRLVLWALLPLLLAGFLLGGAGHELHHGHDDAGQPCLACHLTATKAPEPFALAQTGQRVELAFTAPAQGPDLLAPAARLTPRAPPERIAA